MILTAENIYINIQSMKIFMAEANKFELNDFGRNEDCFHPHFQNFFWDDLLIHELGVKHL